LFHVPLQSLWSELFLRWVVDQTPQKKAWEAITSLREKDKELRLKAMRLRRQLADLEKEAVEAGILPPATADPVPTSEVAANA
jgi:myotubularin-related protein 9